MGLKTTKAAVNDWSFFRVSGRGTTELLIWPTVANPLNAAVALDNVLLGIDEDANILWAVELRVDGAELVEPDKPEPEAPTTPPEGQVVVTGRRSYRYIPATSVPHHWHPSFSPTPGMSAARAGALADLNERPIDPRPGPASRLLHNPAAGPNDPFHEIAPGAIPRSGIRIDRRYVLGRRVDGQPVLWIQRRRFLLFTAPASTLRFDVLEEILETRLRIVTDEERR